MALVRIEGPEAAAVAAMAERAAKALRGQVQVQDVKDVKGAAMRVLGPAPAPIERLRGRYRWQVVVRSAEAAAMRAALADLRRHTSMLRVLGSYPKAEPPAVE